MSAVAPYPTLPRGDLAAEVRAQSLELVRPEFLVRWAFYLSVFCIPFMRLYLPGTGDRLGVTRGIQVLILCAILAQPRVCVRFVPIAVFWFLGYCVLEIGLGLWLTPELRAVWWPRTLSWLQFSLPWLWIMFNVLHFPGLSGRGLWALAWGCSLCALLHIAGVGVVELDKGIEGRSSIFGENANVMGATYAVAVTAMIGLGMSREWKLRRRIALLPLIAVVAIGLAKTGSRGGVLILLMGIAILIFQGRSFGSRTKRFAVFLLIGALLAGIAWQIPTAMKRFERLDRSNLDRQETRVRMMPVLADIFSRSPLYGSGPAGYESELAWRAMPHRIKYQLTANAHNLFWKLLVETGVIGLLLFAAGIRPALVGAWRARLHSWGSLPLALILPQVIAGIAFMDPSHHLVFWFAVAYGLVGEKAC
jgi:O-antigen ligase